jgi:integrase/recombinase XerD
MPKTNPGYGAAGRVNILKKVKVNGSWGLYPAVVESTGKLKDKVRVKGSVEVHPEGHYFIEWWEGPKRRREQVAERTELLDRARRKSLEVEAARIGVPVATLEQAKEPPREKGATISEAVDAYLENIKPPQREPRTYIAYKCCLKTFAANCKQCYVADVKRDDMLAFIRHLYSIGNGGRTAYNRAVIVAQMLKANGVVNLLQKRDWPDYVEPMRPVYEQEELEKFFAACTEEERTLYTTYLLTGFREKEVRYLTWRDVDFRNQTIRVTAKPQYDFKPKNKEEREVPVPQSLLDLLQAHREKQSSHPSGLVFPTANHAPDKKHENKLKKIAWRSGLNCCNCLTAHRNNCSKGPYCHRWFLHKFRHTFATRNLQEHVCDIRTLQLWLGHSDLASTMVYLKAVRSKDVLHKLNGSALAALAAMPA